MSKKPPFPHSGCVPRCCPPYRGSSAQPSGNCTRTYCLLMSTTEAYLPSRLRQPEAAMAQKGQPPRSPSLSSVSAITGCLLMSHPGQSIYTQHKYVNYIKKQYSKFTQLHILSADYPDRGPIASQCGLCPTFMETFRHL